MNAKAKQAMTFGQLKAAIAKLNDDQLAMPVRWVGDERGGPVQRVDVLDEEFIDVGEGMEPASAYADDPEAHDEIVARWPEGTPLLCTDEHDDEASP